MSDYLDNYLLWKWNYLKFRLIIMKLQPLDGKAINYSFIFWSLYYWVQERKHTRKNFVMRICKRHRYGDAFRSLTGQLSLDSWTSDVFRPDAWPVWYKFSHDETIKSTLLSTDYLTVIFIIKSTSQEDYDQRINLFPTSFNIIACQTSIVSFWFDDSA